MPPKKSHLSARRKYWYCKKKRKPDEQEDIIDEPALYVIDNEDSLCLIANEEQVISCEKPPKKLPRIFSEHNYFSTSEKKRESVEHYVDKGVNTDNTIGIVSGLVRDNSMQNVSNVGNCYERLWNDVKSADIKPFVFNTNMSYIQLIEFYNHDKKQSIKWIVNIDKDYKVTLSIHNQEVASDHLFWTGLPNKFVNVKDIMRLLLKLSSHSVCCGNPDKDFQDLIPISTALNDGKTSDVFAYREGNFLAQKGVLSYSSTIRSVNCSLLVYGKRCSSCSKYRDCLRKRKVRINDRKNNPVRNYVHLQYKHSMMDRDTLLVKLKQQYQEIKSLQQEILKTKHSFQH